MITALIEGSFDNIQFDAGVIVIGFDPATYTDASTLKTALASYIGDDTKCLGATRGGSGFKVTKESRVIEVDGRRYSYVGDTRIDFQEAVLSTKLIEITKGNLCRGLASATAVTASKVTTITPNTNLSDSDYIEKLCWVGETAEGVMCILLENAINEADFNYTINEKGEGELDVEFHAKQSSVDDYDHPPFKIFLIEN